LLDSEEKSKRIAQAEEIAKFLRENVVQGEAVDAEASRYSMWRIYYSLY
jgi:complex III assembly factor LYRM7